MTVKKPQKKYYYHITSFQGWLAIKDKGLGASKDGYIYILDTDDNAVCTMLLRKLPSIEAYVDMGYGVFKIDPAGITEPIEADSDGLKYDVEHTLKHQFRVKQKIIEPKYLKNLSMRHIIDPATFTDTRKIFRLTDPN